MKGILVAHELAGEPARRELVLGSVNTVYRLTIFIKNKYASLCLGRRVDHALPASFLGKGAPPRCVERGALPEDRGVLWTDEGAWLPARWFNYYLRQFLLTYWGLWHDGFVDAVHLQAKITVASR